MAQYQVLSWRGIPAQVKVFEPGKRPLSRELPGRQQEIDRVAMAEGLTGTDEYLSHWQWSERQEHPGTAEEVLEALLREFTRPAPA